MEVIYRIIDGSSQVCFSIGMKAIIKTHTHTSKGGKRIKVKFPVSLLVNLVLRAWSAT